MKSPKRLARMAGLIYLFVAVFAGFAHLFVRAKVYVPGDAATTAANVAANTGLVRVGFFADLVQATLFLALAMMLYVLLKHVHADAARAMVVIVAVAVAIICINMVYQLGALLVATDPSYSSAFGSDGPDAMVLLLLDLQHNGYLIAQIFFGLWLLPLGYLAYRSMMFPRPLGVVLMVASICYLVDLTVQFFGPEVAGTIAPLVLTPPIIAEFWMLGYLLIKGVRTQPAAALVPAQA